MKLKRSKPSPPQAHFIYTDPSARSVAVAGNFTNWAPTPLVPKPGGVWSRQLPLKPGTYEYRFVVDGTWVDDPTAAQFISNAFGTRNSVLRIADIK